MPRLAMSGSLVLGLVSAGLLIYSIHHLASSIQIDAIMGQVEREARWVIDDLYPYGSGYLEPEQRCPDPPASAAVLPAGRSGYLQAVQPEPLIRATARQDLVVWLARQVGDHVVAGTPLAFARRRDLDQPAADAQALQAALAAAVAIGFERTMVQDVPFGLRRLVDIGNKVLSPAVNASGVCGERGPAPGLRPPPLAWYWRMPSARSPSRLTWSRCRRTELSRWPRWAPTAPQLADGEPEPAFEPNPGSGRPSNSGMADEL
jgi:hypothetical protein